MMNAFHFNLIGKILVRQIRKENNTLYEDIKGKKQTIVFT